MTKPESKLIIGISSRALFDLDESHEIYEKDGVESYKQYQIENEEKRPIIKFNFALGGICDGSQKCGILTEP